ncbi:peptidase MA family metallohydrolase [Pseudobacteriovorax antillogorgiicola]|uniref:Peptidase MA-like domain-containing protein n=1 Tax=Pseudobacteriovorax antillogorgiicola TaxID=1513793 RepID=A0A1Y6CCR7_9BACT|nr:hypothetical protein [Pseudobacteriovorax antillogorgiicola]TCS48665.1 hypothetical protein EDD56_11787 [Pseudobacteriovorax antillogorgiicola]SMF55049.1 hypothetical protein SAMN06296036_11772 [Pseudobacteriovorax antillogorgiicola]
MKPAFYLFMFIAASLLIAHHWLRKPSALNQEPVVEPLTPPSLESPADLSPSPSVNSAIETIVALYEQKNFAEALRLTRQELNRPGIDEQDATWLERQLPRILISLAWALVQEKNCGEAIPLFEEAFRFESHPMALKGLGACYYLNKDYWSASTYMGRYLEAHYDFESVIVQLESLESLGQYEDAWLLIESSLERDLDERQRQALQKRRLTMSEKRREADHQTHLDGSYVRLHYRAIDHESLGLWSIDVLDQAVESIVILLDLPYPRSLIEVYLYPIDGFQKIHHGPSWAQGLFDGRIRIPIPKVMSDRNQDLLSRTFRHEISHALLAEQNRSAHLPTWFQEGLAQYLECPDQCRSFQFPMNRGSFLSQGTFENSFTSLNHQTARIAYSQSLFLVQNLITHSGIEGIRQIIKNQRPVKSSRAGNFLSPINLSFTTLYEISSHNWQAGKKL